MNRKVLIIISLIMALVVVGCEADNTTSEDGSIKATGMIEARSVNVSSETGGRVINILVEEGQSVTAGDTLIELDDSTFTIRRTQAQFALDAATAQLNLLKSGATDEQMQAAEAQVRQAEANLQLAQASLHALTDARPDEISASYQNLQLAWERYYTMQVSYTSDQLEDIREMMSIARDNLASSETWRERLEDDDRTSEEEIALIEAAIEEAEQINQRTEETYRAAREGDLPYYLQIELGRLSLYLARANEVQAQARLDGLQDDEDATPKALDAAEAILEDSQALVEAAETALDALTSGGAALRLDAAWAEVEQAELELASYLVVQGETSVEMLLSQINIAMAARDMALAQLAALERGPSPEEVAAAEAMVAQAQAEIDALDHEIEKLAVTAPTDGIVVSQSIEPGELALPGATLLQLADLEQVTLTVFVPEDQIGKVHYGQKARISIDTYPDRIFEGEVTYIAEEAEFTPENIQTEEQRVNLVFEVKIVLDNPDYILKPGMPADVDLIE